MSHAAHPAELGLAHGPDLNVLMAPENISPAPGRGAGVSTALLAIGIIGILATIAGGFVLGAKHALAAYHIGAMTALSITLGSTFWVMTFHLTGAGWSVTIRRQFENLMVLTPVVLLLVLPVLVIEMVLQGRLFAWMNPGLVAGDVVYQHKRVYLNEVFFVVRAGLYVLVWTYLTRQLWWYSTEQDRTGDRWLSNKARFTSSWGMLAFALTVAFAAFDWLMTLDYRFFSTMWGVYFFAGAVFSSLAAVVLILFFLRRAGKLRGLVTNEHAHDMGKLMFGFTVFWAYIAFSQYFLIWYGNIPEETAFFLARKSDGWQHLSTFLVIGHFALPFYILLWRFIRRSFPLLAILASWAIFMQVADLVWIVRPMVYAGADFQDKIKLHTLWLDLAGIGGVLALFAGLAVRRINAGVLTPTNDPRLAEAAQHRNYV